MAKKDEFHVLQGRVAGFVTRLIAYVLDFVVLAGMIAVGGWLAVIVDDLFATMGLEISIDIGTVFVFLIPLIIAFYFVVFWALTGRTIGKWFMGLKVIGKNGRPPTIGKAFIRLVGYGISAIAFWLGYAWVLVDSDRQAWHDHMATTWVVYDYERHRSGAVYDTYMENNESS